MILKALGNYNKLFWLIALWCLVLPTQTVASVHLDQSTLSRGYTITHSNGSFSVGIQPNAFANLTQLRGGVRKIAHPKRFPRSKKNKIGDIYAYGLASSQQTNFTFQQPLVITLLYPQEERTTRKVIKYWNTTQKKWKPLPTTDNPDNFTVQANFNKQAAVVGVFKDSTIGPVKDTDFQSFGDITATAAIAIDNTTGAVLYEKNSQQVRSIASLTKLMTGQVLVSQGIDQNKIVSYKANYEKEGAKLYVDPGETMSMKDLLFSMTVGSANNAAYALVGESGYSIEKFAQLMNNQAKKIGLEHTYFVEPSGLNASNVSTAADYAKLMQHVLTTQQMLELTTTRNYNFSTRNTGEEHHIATTNRLIRNGSNLHITGSKTGFTYEAGYCLAMKAREGDHEVITVVLGAPNSTAQFGESERLMNWAFKNYQW